MELRHVLSRFAWSSESPESDPPHKGRRGPKELSSERPCELEVKDHVKKRSAKVKMLADGNFATHFAWAISAYPQGTAIIMLHRQGRIVQLYVMLAC
jgi:hypothetical protein